MTSVERANRSEVALVESEDASRAETCGKDDERRVREPYAEVAIPQDHQPGVGEPLRGELSELISTFGYLVQERERGVESDMTQE